MYRHLLSLTTSKSGLSLFALLTLKQASFALYVKVRRIPWNSHKTSNIMIIRGFVSKIVVRKVKRNVSSCSCHGKNKTNLKIMFYKVNYQIAGFKFLNSGERMHCILM